MGDKLKTETKRCWTEEDQKTKDKLLPFFRVLADQSSKLMSQTSLHGAQHVINTERRALLRGLWLVVVVGMAVWLIYNLGQLYSTYSTFPHTTTVTAIQRDTLPLPALSLCLKDPLDRRRLQEAFPQDHLLLEQFFVNRPSLNWSDPRVMQALGQVTMQEVMSRASFTAQEVLEGHTGLARSPINVSSEVLVQDFFLSIQPNRCFVYNADRSGTKDGRKKMFNLLDRVTLYLRVPQTDILPLDDVGGMYVIVHKPWENAVSWRKTDLAFGTYVNLGLFPRRFRYLPAPYNSLGGKDCLDSQSPDFRSPLRHFRKYSVIGCTWELASLMTTSQCGCVTVGDVDNSGLPHCTLLQLHHCYLPLIGRALLKVFRNSSTCPMECEHTTVEAMATAVPFPSHRYYRYREEKGLLVQNRTDRDSLKLSVKFERDVEYYYKHVPVMTLNDIYSAVGGQMGLFLGASLLTMMELGELVVQLLWTVVTALCGRRHHLPPHPPPDTGALKG